MAIVFKHLVPGPNGETRIVGRRLTAYDVLCQYKSRSRSSFSWRMITTRSVSQAPAFQNEAFQA